MRLRRADDGLLPSVRTLWKEAFGDTDQDISLFFQHHAAAQTLVCVERGEVCAMLSWFWMRLVLPDKTTRRAAYLYAVATRRAYRGRGLAGTLLREAERCLQAEGAACVFLSPASESLFDFYARFGYQRALSRAESVCAAEDCGLQLCAASPEDYAAARDPLLRGGYVAYGESLSYQQALCRETGGGLYLLSRGRECGCACVSWNAGQLRIEELLPPSPMLAAGLCAALGARQASCVTQGEMGAAEEATQWTGMTKWLSDPPPDRRFYFPFAFG